MLLNKGHWSDVLGRDHKINNMKLNLHDLQHLQVNKETPTRQHYGETPQTCSKNIISWGAPLSFLYTNARGMGNKQRELET